MFLSCTTQFDAMPPEHPALTKVRLPRRTNRDLIERTLAEDYEIYRRSALKRLRNRSEAEDILQAFCLKALERAHQLRNADAVHGWLRRLFETTLLDHFRASTRHNARVTPLEDDAPLPAEFTTKAFAIDEESTVETVLSSLRPAYADIIRHMDLSPEPASEVADRLSISSNNLAVRHHRARNAFREALADVPLAVQV